MTADRQPQLIRIERIYPIDHPSSGHIGRKVDGPNGRLELALFGPDGREVVDLEIVKRAFFEINSRKVDAVFREERWVVERHGMRCLVVRTIDVDGEKQVIAINALNGENLGPALEPDPTTRSIWGRLIEATVPAP